MRRSITLWVLVGLGCCAQVQAQTIWTQRSERPGIRLEFLSPQFKDAFPGVSYTYNILTLSGRVPLGEIVAVLVEVPMAWESYSSPFGSDSKNGVGNAFIGLEIGSRESAFFGEVGTRPFLRQDLGAMGFPGFYGDYERAEAYIKETQSFEFALNVVSTEQQGFVYRIRVGATNFVHESGDATTFIDYGAKTGYDDGTISVYAGLTGRASTEKQPGKTAYHHVGFDVGYRFGALRPAIFFGLPLDEEISEFVPQTIGGSIIIEL